jgi:L-threonylcarbamoyladenylate synthase
MPTDTIYGIVASVKFPKAIERIYKLTGRPDAKPFIILVSDLPHLNKLKIEINETQKQVLSSLWPGPVSAILPSPSDSMDYIHRGKKSIAVRMPELQWLRDLISKTGPIVATSANRSGEPTPDNIAEIERSLPDFDFYVGGPVSQEPSRLVRVEIDGSLHWVTR